jgi:hypothetical protein
VQVRKVDVSGKLSIKGVSLSAGKAFRASMWACGKRQRTGVEVWWYSTKVGMIDLKKRSIIMGKGC